MGKILLVVALFGLVVYGAFWLLERRRRSKAVRRSGVRPALPKRVVAPDDDEDFLRELERRRRRAAREQKPGASGTPKPSAGRGQGPGPHKPVEPEPKKPAAGDDRSEQGQSSPDQSSPE